MVPVYVLLVALPFAACGMPDMAQMQAMMAMMNQMEASKHWGGYVAPVAPVVPATPAPVMSMNTKEEYDAYLKWCEENRARQAEQMKQQELLDAFKAREAARMEEEKKEMAAMEAKERADSMQAQWRSWERKLEMSHSFDSIAGAVMEMKHKYYYMVTFEFLKFCKCSDFAAEIEHFFTHEGVSTNEYEEFDLADLGLDAVSGQDPVAVAAAINQISAADQTKAFFGGLAASMCEGARAYFNQVVAWENQYNFLERLH